MRESVAQWGAEDLNHLPKGLYISRTKKIVGKTDSAQRHKVATTVALGAARTSRRKILVAVA
jgi:hypothetical protein